MYKIRAFNDSGEDVADVHVIVLDRPGVPEGPLDPTNIRSDGCTLSWNPPQDDGGADISHYLVSGQE